MESVPPPPNFNNAASTTGSYQVSHQQPPHPTMYAANPYAEQQPFQNQKQYERAQQALRRSRNIRGGLFVFTAICCTKIGLDGRVLYFEEKSLLETLAQADRDCNNSSIKHNLNSAAGISAANARGIATNNTSATTTTATTSFLDSYCYAANHFPIATVRSVVVGALQDFEQSLANSLEPSPSSSSFGANTYPTTTRQFPAQLFGNSIQNALVQNGLTKENFERNSPFISNKEAGVRPVDHTVLRAMLKVGQVLSFDGLGSIWDAKKIAANSRVRDSKVE